MDLQTFYEETGFAKFGSAVRAVDVDDEFNSPNPSKRDWIRLEFDQRGASPEDQVLPHFAFDQSSHENSLGQFLPDLDWIETDGGDVTANWSVVEESPVAEQELEVPGAAEEGRHLLDISQSSFDLWCGDESSPSSTTTKRAKAVDYPTYYDDTSSESDFDFEESEDFVLINFHRKKKSRKVFAKKTFSFSDDDSPGSPLTKSTPKPTQIVADSNSTIIQLNEEKLNKATEYFNIDINDIKKYYTNKGECLLCGNIYFSSATAKRHIKLSHMKLREFSCPQCFLSFQEHKGVKEHLRRYHPEYEIVDLRLVKKEFRKSIVGGYLQDRINPDIFEEKTVTEKVFKARKFKGKTKKKGSRKKYKGNILLSCEYCDEKFKHTSTIRSHISRFHSNPETSTPARQRPRSSASLSQKRRKKKDSPSASFNLSLVDQTPGLSVVKKEPEDENENGNRILRRERRNRKLDAQRDLLQSLLTELNEDENVSQLLSGKKIKVEPNFENPESVADTDGFIGLQQQPTQQTKSPGLDDDMDISDIVFQLSGDKKSNDASLIDCPKCQLPLKDIQEFNSHMLHHWKENKACAVCSSPKSTKQNLLVHIRLHSGEKPFECRNCKAAFKQQSQADHHQKRCKVKQTAANRFGPAEMAQVNFSGDFTSPAVSGLSFGGSSSKTFMPRKLSKHGKPLGRPRKIKFR